jgi:adenylate kinase
VSSKTDIFVFIGPPGSGKGSLSNLCSIKLGWVQLSTGNLCRKHIAEKTEIGKQIDFAIKSGKLVSDSLVTSAVEDWFRQNLSQAQAVILDGYPRTVAQAKALQELILKGPFKLNLIIVRFAIPDEKVLLRLCSRFICENISCQAIYSLASGSALKPKKHMSCDACGGALIRRKDDDEEAVIERLKIYHRHEQDLLNFYERTKQPIKEVQVEKPLDEVFEEFKNLVGFIN